MTGGKDVSGRCFQLEGQGGRLHKHEKVFDAPEGDEVLVEIAGCGVCHTDIHLQDGHFDLGDGRVMPLRGVPAPVIPGHEIAGRVMAVGPEAGDVAVGDSVLVFPWIGCGDCLNCKRGLDHLCLRPQYLGMFADGGFQDYLLVPSARYVVTIGDLDPKQAAPLACSGLTTYSALKKFGPTLSEAPLVIFGAGGLGLMAIRLLAAMGHPAPAVFEVDAGRRAAAVDAGAREAIDPADREAVKAFQKSFGGPILQVLDLVGTGKTAQLAINMLATGGKVVIVGLIGGSMNLSVPLFPLKSIIMQGSFVGSLQDMHELVALAKDGKLGEVPIDVRSLDEANAALDDLRSGNVVGRIVLVPEAAST